jgi:hypothetical protein
MMKTHVLKGSKDEIAESFVRINGTIHEVIVFVEESSESIALDSEENIFAEMETFTARSGGADYSRQALYTPMEGE